MKLWYKGTAKYMKGLTTVNVVEVYNTGSFVLYLFLIEGKKYAVSKN